jgi:hypothetical protein
MHPKSLTLPHIRQYCLELGIRYLIVFNSRTVKTTNLVTIKDLHADRADGPGAPGTSGKGSKNTHAHSSPGASGGGDPNSLFQINIKDVRAWIRGRFKCVLQRIPTFTQILCSLVL